MIAMLSTVIFIKKFLALTAYRLRLECSLQSWNSSSDNFQLLSGISAAHFLRKMEPKNSNNSILYFQIKNKRVCWILHPCSLRKFASGYPLHTYFAGCSVDTVSLYLFCLSTRTIYSSLISLCHMDSARQNHMDCIRC